MMVKLVSFMASINSNKQTRIRGPVSESKNLGQNRRKFENLGPFGFELWSNLNGPRFSIFLRTRSDPLLKNWSTRLCFFIGVYGRHILKNRSVDFWF